MTNRLTDKELASLARLPADERYEQFVSMVVASGDIWSLRSEDGWVAVTSEEGEECLPVWPDASYAADWATGDWSDCAPEAVPLQQWLERWTRGMERDGTLVAVFPNADEGGVVVTPAELHESLEAELQNRE